MTIKSNRIIREKECKLITGIPTSTRYEMIRKGKFPRPIKLGERAVGWIYQEVCDFIEERKAERDNAEVK